MALHNEIGKWGEKTASDYLVGSGYAIVDTNWRFRRSEIDIVAQTGNTIVFVEVKTRTGNRWRSPEESIDLRKRKLLFEAADAFMQQYPDNYAARFDVITIEKLNNSIEIKHYCDALTPELF
ncbi:MAG TPA: YraN family protein [Bacteroidales bacterium]|nr:YraN family protein [Bacteroidales bacterium]